jgi:hypothetical protein
VIVRAKMYVQSVTRFASGQTEVKLNCVTSGSEENKSFAKYTPSGGASLSIDAGTPASDAFKQGQEFYLDFIPVE